MTTPWPLDPAVTFLNHGSFGSCPRPVQEAQSEWRARIEREPVRFFVRELEGLLDATRAEIAAFVGADADDLALVTNATTAVNAVLGSLRFEPGDELVCTDHGYNACWNALARVAGATGARVVRVHVPFPLASGEQIVDAVLGGVTARTRLVLVDHVTSPTGLVFPVARLVAALAERGVDTLVDGAHGPGMVPLALDALGAAYYTGNFHKWCCAPKGAALLHVRRDRQAGLRPAVVSHGANLPRTDRSRFRLEFDWAGTQDWTAALSVPAALRFMASLSPGGWPAVMADNRAKALAARHTLAAALRVPLPAPDELIGALAALPLPAGDGAPRRPGRYEDPLQDRLADVHGIQVPIIGWPAPPARLVRVSAQQYNRAEQYERLARALVEELGGS